MDRLERMPVPVLPTFVGALTLSNVLSGMGYTWIRHGTMWVATIIMLLFIIVKLPKFFAFPFAPGFAGMTFPMANGLAAVTASLTANCIVFYLHGPVLWLYLCVSATCGSLYGVLGSTIAARLGSVYGQYQKNVRSKTCENV